MSARTSREWLVKYGPVYGLLAAGIWLALFVVAMALDPTWRIGQMWLSDLGVRPAAWAFNTACVVAGILLLPYASSYPFVLAGGKISWVGAGFHSLAGGFLIGVGIFTEAYGSLHTVVSYGFFGALVIGWVALVYPFQKTAAFGRFGGATVVASLLIILASALAFNAYTLEAIVVLTAVGWGMLTAGTLMWRGTAKAPAPAASGA